MRATESNTGQPAAGQPNAGQRSDSDARSVLSARALGGAQLVLGAALVLKPRAVARRLAGPDGAVVAPWLVRLLGARGVLQGAVTVAVPTRLTLASGAAVDMTHALSMVPVLVGSSRYRHPAAMSAALATVMAGTGAALARAEPRST